MKNFKTLKLAVALMGLTIFVPTDIFASITASGLDVEEEIVEGHNAPCPELPPEIWMGSILPHLTPRNLGSFALTCSQHNAYVTDLYCQNNGVGLHLRTLMVNSLSKAFKDSNLSLPQDFVGGLQHFFEGTKAAPHNPSSHVRALKQLLLPDAIDFLKDSRWGLIRKILKAFPPKIDNTYEEENIGRALAFLANARGLIKGNIQGNIHGDDEIIKIIKALEEVPFTSLFSIAEHAPKFFTEEMCGFERAEIIEALAKISSALMPDSASCALALITEGMNEYERTRIIKALRGPSINALSALKMYGTKFFTANTKDMERVQMIEILSPLSADIIQALFDLEGQEGVDNATIVSLLAQHLPLSDEVIQALEVYSPALLTPQMTEPQRFNILKILAKSPLEALPVLAEFAPRLLKPEMDGLECADIIEALTLFPVDRLSTLVKHIPTLLKGGFAFDSSANTIRAFAFTPLSDLEPLITFATQYLTEDMQEEGRYCLYNILSTPVVKGFSAVKNYLQPFMTDKMNGADRSYIVKALAEAPVISLPKIAQYAPLFMTEEMRGADRAKIIRAIASIPVPSLAMIAKYASSFITKTMSVSERPPTIKTLAKVPLASFPTLAQHAPVFIKRSPTQSHSHSFERDVIKALSPLSVELIQDLASMEEQNVRYSGTIISLLEKHVTLDEGVRQALEAYGPNCLTPQVPTLQRFCIMKALSKHSTEEIAAIADALPNFLTRNLEGWRQVRLIEGLAQIIPGETDRVGGMRKFLKQPFVNREWASYQQEKVNAALTQAPLSALGAMDHHASTFFPEDIEPYDVAYVIKALSPLSSDRIDAIAALISSIFTEELSSWRRALISKVLAKVSADSVMCMADNAAVFFTEAMDHWDRSDIIRALAPLSPTSIQAIADNKTLQRMTNTSVENAIIIGLAKEYREAEAAENETKILGDPIQ